MIHKFHVITYATHDAGYYDTLINNKFNYDIIVLGMGTKWNGFMDKISGVLKYCETINDNDILIFVDGFDTIMINHPTIAINRFQQMKCDVLVSSDITHKNKFIQYMVKNKFGECSRNITANSGMYMGYVRSIKKMLITMLNQQTTDDQEALNLTCNSIKNLKIDEKCLIFKNKRYSNKDIDTSVFVSYPGGSYLPFAQRYLRVCKNLKSYYPKILNLKIVIVLCIFLTLTCGKFHRKI